MPEAARDQFRPLLEPAELAPGKAMQVGDGVGQGVFHGALDTSIARLLGIELRGVGRQVGHREVPRVRGEEGGCPARPVRVPGFRPGKAPRRLIEARLGPQVARQEALREALPEYYERALAENDITPVSSPEI